MKQLPGMVVVLVVLLALLSHFHLFLERVRIQQHGSTYLHHFPHFFLCVCVPQGIEQIKNLEFDELTSEEAPRQPVSSSATTSPTSPATPAGNDPWGVSAPAATATATAPASSSLSDLQQLSNPPPISSPFGGMPAFPGTPAPGFGAVQPGVVQPGASMAFGVPGQQVSGLFFFSLLLSF